MRPRKQDRHLPPCVYHRHGAFYLVRKGKWLRLGTEYAEMLRAYAEHMAPAGNGEMATLIDTALATMRPRLAANTWIAYHAAAGKLKAMFKNFTPQQVKPKDVAGAKLMLAGTPNMANRCLSVLRLVFDYAVEQQLIDSNPAIGVRKMQEAKRERLLSSAEYTAVYEKADPELQIIMDLLVLTGQRVDAVLKLKRSQITGDGIYFQHKTKARLRVRWTDELRAVVARADALHGNVVALTLLFNQRRQPPSGGRIGKRWRAACAAAGVADAQLRDLRAVAATETRRQGGNATKLLGHTTTKMTDTYLRDKVVPSVDGPSIGQFLDVGQKAQ